MKIDDLFEYKQNMITSIKKYAKEKANQRVESMSDQDILNYIRDILNEK